MIGHELESLKRIVNSLKVKTSGEEHSPFWYHQNKIEFVKIPDTDIEYTTNKDNRLEQTGKSFMKFSTQTDKIILKAILSDEIQKAIFDKALEIAENELNEEIKYLKEIMGE